MIRKFVPEDREDYIRFSTEFYNSSAVDKPVPREHFEQGFDEMMRSDVYVQGYMLVFDGNNVGYCVTMKTYSVEAGGITIWIDELFVLEEYRSKGLGRELFKYIEENGDKKPRRIRLEVELENGRAISLYKKMGFEPAPYDGMWKTIL
ncbi:GNAT family N-acetyltransferase [Ruminococcus sp.]|mgnify:FL=1|uniref:GNAT family N-acetyltransferase n=1 Tax=Ruminococcus sp. TaxID=41978 RepID=UPI000E891003|nr:GNAT family N-acetyltransferase [Ruminococcus sp.]HBM93529.1 N-acetyltransferase [Ruminococcus sp.]HCV91588.1 N-acetyltransferase [Ruminococcus sp.]